MQEDQGSVKFYECSLNDDEPTENSALLGENENTLDKSGIDRRPVRRTWLCLLVNMATLFVIIGLTCGFGEEAGYLSWGPSDKLILIGIVINTWTKWAISMLLVLLLFQWWIVLPLNLACLLSLLEFTTLIAKKLMMWVQLSSRF